MNNPDERGLPHLWAHVQEGMLADAGARSDQPWMIEAAVRSATGLLEPAVRSGFDRSSVTPYDVASVVFSLDRLAVVTGQDRWGKLATQAREWFAGRNPATAPVYDRSRGRVADGIDDGRISENSGAEANIETAGALLDDAIASVPLATPLIPS
jgi:hypothetical protein